MGSVISDIECPNCNKKLAPQYFKQHKAKCDLVKGEIKKIEANLSTRFGIHDSTDPKIYTIKIHISKSAGLHLSKRYFHSSQSFTQLKDGSFMMEMKCCINIELIGWVMSWLEHMKVLEPIALKEHIQERAKYIYQMYKNNQPPISPENTDNWSVMGK